MKYALVTGASSGLGKEFAKALSKKYNLILVARREDKLVELSKELDCHCLCLVCDLSKEENCFKLLEKCKGYDIEICINNAGFGQLGDFVDTDIHRDLQMINVNVKAMHIICKGMLQQMKDGSILNVASSAGLLPAGPHMSTYYASKAYITSLTQSIAQELKEKKSKCYVGCLCPGPVNTEFNDVAQVQFALKGMRARDCVDYALKEMEKKTVVIIPTFLMKSVSVLSKMAPKDLVVSMTSYQQKKKM